MKKAPIAVALVLVFGLFTAAFSLAPAVAQYTPPSDSTSTNSTGASTGINQTSSANTTTSTTTNATGGEIFSARGSITTLIFDTGETTTTSEVQNDATTAGNDTSMTGNTTTFLGNATTTTMPQIVSGDNGTSSSNLTDMTSATSVGKATSDEPSTAAEELQPPYVASGDWSLDVKDDSVSDFAANFTMVHIDGTGRHTNELNNFVSSNSSTIDASGNGTSFIFGTVDVAADGKSKWTGVDALIIIENNVNSISLATENTDDHFTGQPIHGVVDCMTDENGNKMIQTGATQTTGNMTQGAENALNERRQQKYPSFLLVQQHWTVVFEKEKIFKIVRLANPDERSAGVRPVDQVGHCHYHHYERL